MDKAAIVKQEGDKWLLMTRDGSRVLGTHSSAREAYGQEYAIQKSQEQKQKKVHDLLFFSRRSTPKVLHPEEVAGYRAPSTYGTLTLRRPASEQEEKFISTGKWLRVDENGNSPRDPSYKKTMLRPQLIRAKQYSDQGRYGPKHSILNKLLFESPEEFYIDSESSGKFPGLTHGPTGFRIHAPRHIALKARGKKEEEEDKTSSKNASHVSYQNMNNSEMLKTASLMTWLGAGAKGIEGAKSDHIGEGLLHGAARGFGADVGAAAGGMGGAGLGALLQRILMKSPSSGLGVGGVIGAGLGGIGGGIAGWKGVGKLTGPASFEKQPSFWDRFKG